MPSQTAEQAARRRRRSTTAALPWRACGLRRAAPSLLKISMARDGVMVMALTAEMIIEAEIVTANWRKKRPVMPVMKAHGTNTAHSTSVMARIGPVISSIALMVAVRVSQAPGHLPFDVFQDHDGVVHHDADGQHQAEQRDVVQAVAQHRHDGEGADQDTGTSIIGRIMARQSCRNTSTTSADQHDGLEQRPDHVGDRLADERRGVVADLVVDAGGKARLQLLDLGFAPRRRRRARWCRGAGRR